MDNRDKLYKNSNKQKEAIKPSQLSNEERVATSKSKLDDQYNALDMALSSITESNEIADRTLEELKKNTATIGRSADMTKKVSDKTGEANQTLNKIERRRKYFGLFDLFDFGKTK